MIYCSNVHFSKRCVIIYTTRYLGASPCDFDVEFDENGWVEVKLRKKVGCIYRKANVDNRDEVSQKSCKIRWWSHVKRMAPTAPQSKALVIQPQGRRPRGRSRNRWEDDVPRWYREMGIPMTDVNNWVKERRPIVYPLDADGSRVRLK